ncbi:MAG: hypothetical protein DRP93_03540 [Candidatus Neomarinimicrobiota bacterium]|nr:MAG: hypothetical protein DRP93_03540 [Candidatus Neomarinimicrobiota bacterium]
MSQTHMTKKELKEDPFFEEVAHIVDFFRKHQNLLISIVVVLALAIGGVFGGKAYFKTQNEKASGIFGIAMDYYNKDMLVDAEDQFMSVVDQYKKTDWGMRSYYYLALINRKLMKNEDETCEYLEVFVDSKLKDAALKASAYQLIGSYYYSNGDMLSAGDNYLNAAKKALSTSEKLNLGIRSGEAYVEAGNKDKLEVVIKYLGTLELNKTEKNRVAVLASR